MGKFKKMRKPAFKKTGSKYRQQVPRTIQIATKRNVAQTLRFVVNQTWIVDPSILANGESCILSYRANSIYKSHMPTNTLLKAPFKSQDPTKYNNAGDLTPAVIQQNADGWDDWKNRFQHFVVTGSKITYTFEPTGTGAPAIFFSHLAGVSSAVTAATTSATINKLPYTSRHSLTNLYPAGNSGIRGKRMYSARRFEGVKDPEDNSNLRGRFANENLVPPVDGNTPSEQTFFYIGLAPIDPSAGTKMGPGILRVKIEYITKVVEPTDTNKIQIVTASGDAGEL